MPIEGTETPYSPGWWLMRLSRALNDPKRLRRFERLLSYLEGHPPLPVGRENCREAFEVFQHKARSNFAETVVTALANKLRPIGVRTAADDDETGDAKAWDIVERSGMRVVFADAHEDVLGLSEGYVIVGDIDPETGVPLVTHEDPREVIAVEDPATGRAIAALKVFHDDVQGKDFAYLYLAGSATPPADSPTRSTSAAGIAAPNAPTRMLVASRTNRSVGQRILVNPQGWDWEEGLSADLPKLNGMLPVVKLTNRRGLGEFEIHTDLLDRINHGILDRMVIATYQAFKRLGAIGLPEVYPPGHPKAGEEIDYKDVFTADPGAIWQLPLGAQMWESGAVDLTPILNAGKDDIRDLSAVTHTPMYMFMPDSVNQSAEGASLAREGLVDKALDRIARFDSRWARVLSLCFRWMGDAERADMARIRIMWEPPEKPSLIERAQAAAQAGDIPWRGQMRNVWFFPPDEIDRMETERAADMMRQAAQQQAMLKAQAEAQAAARPPQPAAAPQKQPGVSGGSKPTGQASSGRVGGAGGGRASDVPAGGAGPARRPR